MSILELESKVDSLAPEEKRLFERIFYISSSSADLEVPASFRAKTKEYFGERNKNGKITDTEEEAVEKLKTQTIVRIFNRWTGEDALFNWLRARRPRAGLEEMEEMKRRVREHIEDVREGCDFCQPEKYTPADVFGRLRGKHCITAANIAKYDARNGLVIFDSHNPLEFGREELSDYIETGLRWLDRVHELDGRYKYPFLIWNCLEKAGASMVHGHIQVMIGKDRPYGKVSALRRASEEYNRKYGKDYFEDLFRVHEMVGLAMSDGETGIFAHLTPVKEKETVIIAPSMNDGLKDAIFNTLRCYIDKLGMTSFNLSIYIPLHCDDNFPYIAKIVDRGSILRLTSDIGAMELYGSSVIATDPHKVIEALKEWHSK